ncbi:MAG: methyltransferase domain-containing protein [Gemmatimonadaceae bacterium]
MEGREATDEAATDPGDLRASLRDIRRTNAWLGGTRAAVSEVLRLTRGPERALTLLDVGAGTGDVARAAQRALGARGVHARTIAVEQPFVLAAIGRPDTDAVCAGDALALPFADRSVDVVLCAQVLHHFDDTRARQVIAELDRVARVAVVIAELERSRVAAAAFRVIASVFRFHPITVHDGLLSIARGFEPDELRDLVLGATGRRAAVRRRIPFRLTATWPIP